MTSQEGQMGFLQEDDDGGTGAGEDGAGLDEEAAPPQPQENLGEDVSFEEALDRLEDVVNELEGGDLSLDRSLTLFQQGVVLARVCSERLDDAEERIDALVEGDDGSFSLQPLESTGDE